MPAYQSLQLHHSTGPNTTSMRASEVMARLLIALLSKSIQLIQLGDKSSHTRANGLSQPAGRAKLRLPEQRPHHSTVAKKQASQDH